MNAPALAVGRWELDATTSTARFVAHQLGRSIPGAIPFLSARCDIDDHGLPQRVAATLDLSAIDTGNPRRDRDLAKPGLLDIAAHPYLTVELADPSATTGGWTATAMVHARGAVAPVAVTIDTDIDTDTDALSDPASGVTVRVRGRLDRLPLGIRAPRFAIGRWVDLDVTARFRRA